MMKSHTIALLSGTLFGLGLSISQMVNPEKVLAFLDIFGHWDPSLLLVIGSATGLTIISFRWILRLPHPLFAKEFRLPNKTDIDKPLILGAALFGLGWGIAGYCPGPALAALTLGSLEPYVFVACLLLGAYLQSFRAKIKARKPVESPSFIKEKSKEKGFIVKEEWKDGPDI